MSDLPIIIATIISILVFQLYYGWDKIPEISNIECCEKISFDLIYLLNMIIHFSGCTENDARTELMKMRLHKKYLEDVWT